MSIRIYKKGFTLIELLVVIAIIGLLASVVLASLETAREKSRDAKRLSDAKQVQLALELYFDDNGSYPVENTTNQLLSDIESDLVPTYIPSLPVDPTFTGTDGYRYGSTGNGSANPEDYSVRIQTEGDSWCLVTSGDPPNWPTTQRCSEI